MKKLALMTLAAFVATLALASCASTGKLTADRVGKNEIIVVGKIICDPPLTFVRKDVERQNLNLGVVLQARGAEEGAKLEKLIDYFDPMRANRRVVQGELFTMKSRKAETLDMLGFFLQLHTNADAVFPAAYTFDIPKGARAVYVGTFKYKLNEYLEVVGREIVDDYDEAAEALAKDFPGWELERAELVPIDLNQ